MSLLRLMVLEGESVMTEGGMAAGGQSRTLTRHRCLRLPGEGIRSGSGLRGGERLGAGTELESSGKAACDPTC